MADKARARVRLTWEPQRGPQTSALLADWCDELFFGGERGGGKSDFQLGYQEDGALRYGKDHRGIMFRKTYAELEELQARAMEIFPASGGIYKTQPSAEYAFSNSWYWPNGASVKMRYIEREEDYGRYHGHSYSAISADEVTEYASPGGILRMISTLRSPAGIPCTMRLTGNPGGIGHAWVKQRYIDSAPPYTPYTDPDSGFTRMFIPSKTADNAILLTRDPRYRDRIKASTGGNEALRKAWLEGNWDIVAGAFFDCWDKRRHVVKPFDIPEGWARFRSGDWGSARPFSFGWWALVSDDYKTEQGITLPRGCMVRYREWYGCRRDSNGQQLYNTGLKLDADVVGQKLAELEATERKKMDGVLDPAAFSHDGGPSIAERLENGSGMKVQWRRADNTRVSGKGAIGGWDAMRARLIGESEDRPMLVLFDTCKDSIRTIPALQHDKNRIEDVDTDGEDHAGDDVRYACNSRPWLPPKQEKPPPKWATDMSFNELRDRQRRAREMSE
ncbi:Terminase-like family [uncultured Caudovirales phage]|uniref:Terminase-like family n=1 Tax=uncultured Caudovirales phage TaxID=2100421 RepID=A0A6J5QU54_9CAUD|nr:Terminase-like family [uncultured Caudovirales phage]